MPPDLSASLRLDINRPLGNGRDDNNNRVVDEPGEWDDFINGNNNGQFDAGEEPAVWASNDAQLAAFTNPNTGQFRDASMLLREASDRNNDGFINATDRDDYETNALQIVNSANVATATETERHSRQVVLDNLRRQVLARDLYVTAMTLIDPPSPMATPADRRALARRMAQWAINVVDFRDPDNIMTAFEYDATPFNGWAPDANTATTNDAVNVNGTNKLLYGADNAVGGIGTNADEGGVVWGAEGAELVMTETMAWHDRRTTDESSPIESSNFVGGFAEPAAFVTDPADWDYDFDQLYRPRGACFVELYCPLAANPAANADTHAIGNGTDDFDFDGAIDPIGQDSGIDLARTHTGDRSNPGDPVWRLAVYQRPAGMDALDCADWDPDAVDEKARPYDTSALKKIDVDRCIYFATIDTSDASQLSRLKDMDPSDGVEFFTTLEMSSVRPGRFMVVGSGEPQDGTGRKMLGSDIYGANIGDKGATASEQRRIELRPNDLVNPIKFIEPMNTTDQLGDELALQDPDLPNRAITDVALITNALSSTGPSALKRKFTITEPAKGYPGDDPAADSAVIPGAPPPNPAPLPFYDGDATEEGRYGNIAQAQAYDTPLDDNRLAIDGERRLSLDSNFDTDEALIVEGYSMLYLQRLANPMRPYNRDTNPYRTVDSMSANASVFNGRYGDPINPGGEVFQPAEEPDNPGTKPPAIEYSSDHAANHLASLQRGYAVDQIARANSTEYQSNVMSYEPPNAEPGPLTAGGIPDPENKQLAGFGVQTVRKNQFFGAFPHNNSTIHAVNAIPDMTLGRMNNAFLPKPAQVAVKARNISSIAPNDLMTPEEPYPWLTWNNRPFAGSHELLMVPRSSSTMLLREFSGQVNSANPFTKADVPKKVPAPNPTFDTQPVYTAQENQGSFGHLPNMQLAETPESTKLPDVPAGLYRVLDYLHVPSPYVGLETWLSPVSFGSTNVTDVNDPRYLMQPPFNRISEFREPGKVNVNTVTSAEVWDGGVLHRELDKVALAYDPLNTNPAFNNNYISTTGHSGPLFVDTDTDKEGLLESRRGYSVFNNATTRNIFLDNSLLALDARVPTFFANPFRSGDAGNLVPLNNMQRFGADCTMIRRKAFNPGFDGQWGQAGNNDNPADNNIVDDLAEFDKAQGDVEDEAPLFGGESTEEYNNAERNAYFKVQPASRLSSMTTTRSNVYAVWVTIGFFEVEEADDWATDQNGVQARFNGSRALYDRVYPEGYQLGQEAGLETGNIHRVREFAMVDRTVPVAFEPGQNHNVDKAIRLRRRIE